MTDVHNPHLFAEMDQTCEFKHYLLDNTGKQCKKPYCEIGFFECQWIDNCIPCPLRWQWKDWDGWGNLTPETKVKIVNNATTIVTTLASNHGVEIPEITTIFDLLDATRVVQLSIEKTETTEDTLNSIVETLERLNVVENVEEEKEIS